MSWICFVKCTNNLIFYDRLRQLIFWKDYPVTMRITSHDSIAMLHQKSPSSGHPFTYRQRNILQNRVYKCIFTVPFVIPCGIIFFFTVIVTEKTNILLRYLHQQWERKVYQVLNRYIIVNQIRISWCIKPLYLIMFQNKKRESANEVEEGGSAKKRPRLDTSV